MIQKSENITCTKKNAKTVFQKSVKPTEERDRHGISDFFKIAVYMAFALLQQNMQTSEQAEQAEQAETSETYEINVLTSQLWIQKIKTTIKKITKPL